MILALIATCIAFCAVGAMFVVFLTAAVFITIFRKFTQYMNRRRKAISFKATSKIKEALGNGRVTHVAGVWDEVDEDLVKVQPIEAEDVDSDMKRLHKHSDVVVWN